MIQILYWHKLIKNYFEYMLKDNIRIQINAIKNLVEVYVKNSKDNKLFDQIMLRSTHCQEEIKQLFSLIQLRETTQEFINQHQVLNLFCNCSSKKLNEDIKKSIIIKIYELKQSIKKQKKIDLIAINYLLKFFGQSSMYSHQMVKKLLIDELELAIKNTTIDVIQAKYQLWLNQMGYKFLKQSNFEQSLMCFQLASNINPNDVQSMTNIGTIYRLTDKVTQGIQHFQKYIKYQSTFFHPYMGVGLVAKNYPTIILQCESIFNYYSLDKSTDLDVNFNLCLYYQIVQDYGKMEKYFLKCLNIQEKLQKKQVNFVTYFINQFDNIYQQLKSEVPHLTSKILILVGILCKQWNYEQTARQCYTSIMEDYKGNKLSNGFISLFQKQFKHYSLRIQSIFSQFLLCQMFHMDKIESIESFIKFNNLYEGPEQSSFWFLIEQDRKNQIISIDHKAQMIQRFMKKEQIVIVNKEEVDLVNNLNLIKNIEVLILKSEQLLNSQLQNQKMFRQISMRLIQNLRKWMLNIFDWKRTPPKLYCFHQIYRQIHEEEQQIKKRIKQLQKAIVQKKYKAISPLINEIKIFFLTIYPINELTKCIYNGLSYHLFENQLGSIKLYQMLKAMKRNQDYDFSFLKEKIKNIFFQSSQSATISQRNNFNFTNLIKRKKVMSQQKKKNIKEKNNDFIQVVDKQQKYELRRYRSQPAFKIVQMENKLTFEYKQEKTKLQQQEVFCFNSLLQQQKQTGMLVLAFLKCYQKFKGLLFDHVIHLYKLIAQTKTQYIFQQRYQPKTMIETIDEYSHQDIQFFQYLVPRGDTILTYDYSILSKDRDPKILWALSRKHLFSFMRCVAGSINQFNKQGIYHKNISFNNFIKIGQQFKFVGLDEAIFIPREQIQIAKINLSKISFCVLKDLGMLQEQLAEQTYGMIDYFLGFDYNRIKEESQQLICNQSSVESNQNQLSNLPQVDDIPKYILGEENKEMIKYFTNIKDQKYQRRQDKIEKCIKLLKDNYERMNLQQLCKLIQLLLSDQARDEYSNKEKISKKEIDEILSYSEQLQQKKISLCNFIQLLNRIEKQKQINEQSQKQNRSLNISESQPLLQQSNLIDFQSQIYNKELKIEQQQQYEQIFKQSKQKDQQHSKGNTASASSQYKPPIKQIKQKQQITNQSIISPLKIQQLSTFVEQASLPQISEISLFKANILQSVIKQMPTLIHAYQPSLRNLIAALKYRIGLNKKIVEYFPYIPWFIESLHKLIGNEKSSSVFTPQNRRNGYYKQFLKDQQYKIQNPNSFSTFPNDRGQNVQVSQLIWKSKQFPQQEQPFFQHQIQQINERAYLQKRQNRMHFQQNLNPDEMMKIDCLGCTTFMYEGSNIKVNGITKTDAICFPSVHKMTKEHHAIKRSIGALINSGGGVILFACSQEYLSIIAKGQMIIESDQQRIAQQFTEYLSCFYPKLTFQRNAQLRFVPIVKNPFENKINEKCLSLNICQNSAKKQKQYLKGKYVTVIRLWPNQISQIIFYPLNDEVLLYKRYQGETIEIKGREMVRIMKLKFDKNYTSKDQLNILDTSSHCFANHMCPKPQRGQITKISLCNEVTSSQRAYLQELKFNYASIVFLFLNSYQNIKRHLINNNLRNFEFLEQQNIFEGLILLLHDTSPKKIKELIERYPVVKGKKTVLMLNITNSLKINRKMSEREFESALKYLRKKKSNEYLKLWEYNSECYLETGSKVSCYYLFCYLRTNQFKNIKLVNFDPSNICNNYKLTTIFIS